jgi:putative transposase
MLRDLLRGEGVVIGREKVRTMMRRMCIEAIYRRPNTSKPAPGHKIYPYLLYDLAVERPNQVWGSRGKAPGRPSSGHGSIRARTARNGRLLKAGLHSRINAAPARPGFCPNSGLGHGHHIHSNGARLYLSRSGRGLVQSACFGLADFTMAVDFCLDAVQEALARHGKPEVFNTNQGSQFTSAAFTGLLLANKTAISMDGRGSWRDNVFVERLWQSVKYEEVYLRAYGTVVEAQAQIGRYLDFFNMKRPHSSLDAQTPDHASDTRLSPQVAAA